MTTFFCIWRETSDHSWIAAAASGLSLRVHRLHRFWKDLAESVGTGKVVVVFIHVQPNHLTRPSQTPKSETATTQVTKAKGCPKTSPIIAANQKAPQKPRTLRQWHAMAVQASFPEVVSLVWVPAESSVYVRKACF